MPASPTLNQRVPKVGGLRLEDDQAPRVREILPRPYQVALRRLMDAVPVDGQPLSALAWKRAEGEYAELADAIWLHCVLHESALRRRRTAHIRFEPVVLPVSHPLSGNIVVRDVLLNRVQPPAPVET